MNLSYLLDGYNKAQAEGLLGDNNSFAIGMVASIGPAVFLGLAADKWWKKVVAFGAAALILHTVLADVLPRRHSGAHHHRRRRPPRDAETADLPRGAFQATTLL